MAYSNDLRERALAAIERGEPTAAIAARLEVHRTTICFWRRQAARGIRSALKRGARPIPTKLTADDLVFLQQAVLDRPGVTLRELVEQLAARGTRVVESTVCRALIRLGFSFKKSRCLPVSNAGQRFKADARTSARPLASRAGAT